MSEWQPSGFEVQTDQGPRTLTGWVNGCFALDYRTYLDDADDPMGGWHLTHIPTGWSVCGILAPFSATTEMASELLASADWDSCTQTPGKDVSDAFQAFARKYEPYVTRRKPLMGPLQADVTLAKLIGPTNKGGIDND